MVRAMIGVGLMAAIAAGCGGGGRAYVKGLEPTPESVPVGIYASDALPDCEHTLIGRVSAKDVGVEITEDGSFDRRELLRKLRRHAREIGGHGLILTNVVELQRRVVPDPTDADDVAPELREPDDRFRDLTGELAERTDPEDTGYDADPDEDPERVSGGITIGPGGIRAAGEDPEELRIEALVIRFADPACMH